MINNIIYIPFAASWQWIGTLAEDGLGFVCSDDTPRLLISSDGCPGLLVTSDGDLGLSVSPDDDSGFLVCSDDGRPAAIFFTFKEMLCCLFLGAIYILRNTI